LDIETKTVTQYTRNGNENTNFPHLREQFARLLPLLPVSVVFDGEVVGKTFQELMSQLNRGSNAATEDHKLALFDVIPLSDFRIGNSPIVQKKRHDNLVSMIPQMQDLGMSSISVLPKVLVNLSTPEGKKAMDDFRDEVLEAARNAGDENVFEGFMIKDPNAPYVCKKGTHWLKWKPWIAVDLTVVGMEPGDQNGKYAHTLGALVCEGIDEGRHIKTNVATGMTDDQRDYFWKNPHEIIGWIIEVHADELTQNEKEKGTNNYSLRFPSFQGKRGLSSGDKI
jgi:ATP-dependent DNA ligase